MPRITQLYAYVMARDNTDDEAVPAPFINGGLVPLMGADKEWMDSLRGIAKEVAAEEGKPVKLVRSTGLETVDVINP